MSRRRATRAEVEQARRDAIWAVASSATAPDGWREWFAAKFRGLDVPVWQSAPLDLRQRFARDVLAAGAGAAVTTPPGGAVEKCGAFSPETDRPPFRTLARFPRGDTPSTQGS
jgi:hypothetical protein